MNTVCLYKCTYQFIPSSWNLLLFFFFFFDFSISIECQLNDSFSKNICVCVFSVPSCFCLFSILIMVAVVFFIFFLFILLCLFCFLLTYKQFHRFFSLPFSSNNIDFYWAFECVFVFVYKVYVILRQTVKKKRKKKTLSSVSLYNTYILVCIII